MRETRSKRPTALGVRILVGAFLATQGCSRSQPAAAKPPEVEIVTVEPHDVPIYEEWIGTLDGFVNAQIRAEVTGYLQAQDYQEGSLVKRGQLLFQIDPRPFQAALDQAKAQLSQVEAQLGKTELDVKRFTPLAKERAISQEELDDAVQANRAGQAAVTAAQAAVETARLNLAFTKIASPVDGLAGLATAQMGDLVGPVSGILTTVSTINPIRVYFAVSEQSYIKYMKRFADESQREGGEKLSLELMLADGSVYPQKGKFYFADREVDTRTGALRFAGLFPNPAGLLRPGQFARVRAQTHVRKGALLVPQRAVTELQGTYQLAVVGADNRVSLRTVQVAERIGAQWIIAEGIHSGDRVLAEGLQKVHPNTEVTPKPFVAEAVGQGA